MSVEQGQRMYGKRANSTPSLEHLAEAKDYDGLAQRGAMGRGTLIHLAHGGDTQARATLRKLRDPRADLETGQDW